MSNERVDEFLLNACLLLFGIALLKLGHESDRHKARLDVLEAVRDKIITDPAPDAPAAAPRRRPVSAGTTKTQEK